MHSPHAKRSIEANPDELDAKLELLSQLCLTESPRHSRKPSFVDEPHARDNPSKPSYVEEHWLNADYSWVSDAAHDSAVDLSTALADGELLSNSKMLRILTPARQRKMVHTSTTQHSSRTLARRPLRPMVRSHRTHARTAKKTR